MPRTDQDSQHRTGRRISETILFQTSNIVKVVKESRTQVWRDEGLAVLIVWFIWSATGNMSLRLMYANPSPCVFILVSSHISTVPTMEILHKQCCRPHMSHISMSLMLFIFRRFARDQSSSRRAPRGSMWSRVSKYNSDLRECSEITSSWRMMGVAKM